MLQHSTACCGTLDRFTAEVIEDDIRERQVRGKMVPAARSRKRNYAGGDPMSDLIRSASSGVAGL